MQAPITCAVGGTGQGPKSSLAMPPFALAPTQSTRLPMSDAYLPLSRRQRVLIWVLAPVTALTVLWSLFNRPGSPPIPERQAIPDSARCVQGQTSGCVGGMAAVIALPAAPAASAGR